MLPNQVLQHESVAAKLDFGLPGSWFWCFGKPACSHRSWWNQDSELEQDSSALAGFHDKIYTPGLEIA
jgi:hypothetical protein